jgi:hypothetical protein
MGADRARLAPELRPPPATDDLLSRLEVTLQAGFAMGMLSEYTVVVEGTTDRDYLLRAAALVHANDEKDLLAVDGPNGVTLISILSPGSPGHPERGGVPQMVRLARELQPYVFTLDMFSGILFVFDHDDAGLEGQVKIQEYGYRSNVNSMTLEPKQHPNACGKKQVVIEDLLSLDIQKEFFERHPAWCSAEYENGDLVRFEWRNPSKAALRDFACRWGRQEDFIEIIRLLDRVRLTFGAP